MYYLQNNVEIVKGAKNYCIYNLNTKKLFSLTADYAVSLIMLLKGDCTEEDLPEGLIDYLSKEEIIVSDERKLAEKLPQFIYEGNVDFAWIELTQKCNLKCRHCYEEASCSVAKPEMSFADFTRVVDELVEIGVKRIQLVGGEPLIHRDFERMLEYVSGKFEFIEIFTNGTLLTDKLLELIKTNGASLAFSIYSNDSKIHDDVTRISGSHALTSTAITKATEMGIEVRVASVEMKGVPRFEFSCSGVEQRTDFPRLTGRADLSLYTDDMLTRKLITKKTFRKPIDATQYYRNKVIHNCFGDLLYIDCHLDIYPCAMERRISCGNMREVSLREKPFSVLAKMNKDQIDGCMDCEFRYACYDCRSDSCSGAFNSKPWYCTYNEKDATWEDVDEFIAKLRARYGNDDQTPTY